MNRALLAAVLCVCAAALAWGFATVGGPAQARAERNDRDRLGDLRTLGQHYQCALDAQAKVDAALSPGFCSTSAASPPDLRDPVTDAPYDVTRPGPDDLEICATLEAPEAARRLDLARIEGDRACLRYRRDPATGRWQPV